MKNNDISYTKLIISKATDKSKECFDNKIDVMFDDVISNCETLFQNGIMCYLMETKYTIKAKTNLKRVRDWAHLYNTVCDLSIRNLEPVHVILDTDTNNEADDQFALAYLLKSKDRIVLDAVTIAPYSHENDISIKEGLNESYRVCEEIFDLCNEDKNNMIYKGSENYFQNDYFERTDAIRRMAEIIGKNELTYILAIGAITNIAIFIKLYPNLKSKIRIIWLGGHSLMSNDNREYNFKQDVKAVEYVYNSNVDLIVIPCNGVASNLTTSIYELEHYLNIDDGLGKYLYDRFYNDGKHGITKRRTIWDISVIAYMINPYYFEIKGISCPIINADLSYSFTNQQNQIKFAIKLNQNKIYEDLFKKLGDKVIDI